MAKKSEKMAYPSAKKIKILAVVLAVSLLGVLITGYKVFGIRLGNTEVDTTPYEHILNKDEINDWKNKEPDPTQGYVQINTKIPVADDGKTAQIRLINPPYSEFTIEVSLELSKGKDRELYQSKKLEPLTVIEEVTLLQTLEKGEHEAEAKYVFYNKQGKKQGEYATSVTLVCGAEKS